MNFSALAAPTIHTTVKRQETQTNNTFKKKQIKTVTTKQDLHVLESMKTHKDPK